MSFPSWRYHRDHGGRVVRSDVEAKALGPGWSKRTDVLTSQARSKLAEQENAYQASIRPKHPKAEPEKKESPAEPEKPEAPEQSIPEVPRGESEPAKPRRSSRKRGRGGRA